MLLVVCWQARDIVQRTSYTLIVMHEWYVLIINSYVAFSFAFVLLYIFVIVIVIVIIVVIVVVVVVVC